MKSGNLSELDCTHLEGCGWPPTLLPAHDQCDSYMSHVMQLRGVQKYVVESIEALVSTGNLLRALALGCTKLHQGQVRLTCHRAERCDFIAPSPLPLLFPLLSATKPTNPISLFALLSLHFPYHCAKARTKSSFQCVVWLQHRTRVLGKYFSFFC